MASPFPPWDDGAGTEPVESAYGVPPGRLLAEPAPTLVLAGYRAGGEVGQSLGGITVMRRAVLDSDGLNALTEPGAFHVVKRAIEAGELELLSTDVLDEETRANRNPIKRARLQALVDLAHMVPTGAFILDQSSLDGARLRSSPAGVKALQDGNPDKNTNDALIGMTALAEHCALISSDVRLRKRAIELGIEVLHARELLAELGYTGPPT